jgi:hypothetical protein
MKERLRYQDYINDFLAGTHWGVFIDDTGSPGNNTYKYLPSGRKTWLSVIIPPSQIKSSYLNLNGLLSELNKMCGITELHFKDIFGGSKEFRDVAWEIRLGIIHTLVQGFINYQYTIIHQSLDENQRPEWKKKLGLPERLDLFNFNKVEDTALFILLTKLQIHLKEAQKNENGKAHVFIDEGWKKNGKAIFGEHVFGNGFDRGKVCFGSSKDIIFIQLADFAAFVLNRMQITASKGSFSQKETQFMQVIQPMVGLYKDVAPSKSIIDLKKGELHSLN